MALNLLYGVVFFKVCFTDQAVVAPLMNVKLVPAILVIFDADRCLVMVIVKCRKGRERHGKNHEQQNRNCTVNM